MSLGFGEGTGMAFGWTFGYRKKAPAAVHSPMSTIMHSSTLGCFSTSRRVAPCGDDWDFVLGIRVRVEVRCARCEELKGREWDAARSRNAPLRRPR